MCLCLCLAGIGSSDSLGPKLYPELPDGWRLMPVYVGNAIVPPGSVPNKWHGQVLQDKTVQAIISFNHSLDHASGGPPPRSFFLDSGANHAVSLSNTLALERDWGWEGVCIEANPKYWWGHLRGRRRCQLVSAVLGRERAEEIRFTMGAPVNWGDGGTMGGIVSGDTDNKHEPKNIVTLSLATVPMGDILRLTGAPKHIDYWSLDLEGAENMVLSTFPWEEYRVRLLTVERPSRSTAALLKSKGFVCLGSHGSFGDHMFMDRYRAGGILGVLGALRVPGIR